jgi:hypothetical protein
LSEPAHSFKAPAPRSAPCSKMGSARLSLKSLATPAIETRGRSALLSVLFRCSLPSIPRSPCYRASAPRRSMASTALSTTSPAIYLSISRRYYLLLRTGQLDGLHPWTLSTAVLSTEAASSAPTLHNSLPSTFTPTSCSLAPDVSVFFVCSRYLLPLTSSAPSFGSQVLSTFLIIYKLYQIKTWLSSNSFFRSSLTSSKWTGSSSGTLSSYGSCATSQCFSRP